MFGSKNSLGADNQQERLRAGINPWYISGFVDGEGSFHIAFAKRPDLPRKWSIIPEFHINQDTGRSSVLHEIHQYFRCGRIQENHRNHLSDKTLVYVVRDRNDLLSKIIPFFEHYPLRSAKKQDFRLFADIVRRMSNGNHLKTPGFNTIVKQAFQMNYGGRYRKYAMEDILLSESSETIRQAPYHYGTGKI